MKKTPVVKVIPVPKTPKRAFNPSRPLSNLLKAHIVNLEAAVQKAQGSGLKAQGKALDKTPARRRPRSEGQAAGYIEHLTKQLHQLPPARPFHIVPRSPRKARRAKS